MQKRLFISLNDVIWFYSQKVRLDLLLDLQYHSDGRKIGNNPADYECNLRDHSPVYLADLGKYDTKSLRVWLTETPARFECEAT